MAAGGGSRAIVAAFSAHPSLATSELVDFPSTGSSSLPAAAIHSVADTGNQGLLLVGGHLAAIKEVERPMRAVMPTAMYIEPGFRYDAPGKTAPETAP